MLTLEQMVIRLTIALALGAVIGLERELVGKEAGIRTEILVAGGAAIFSIVSITLPYIVAVSSANLPDVVARNSGFLGMAANVVVGIGFLGAGIIIKTSDSHVRGLTTAAVIWATAAVGVLVGVGLISMAVISALLMTGLLYALRKVDIYKRLRPTGFLDGENGE